MKRIIITLFAVLLLAACKSAFTTDSAVGNWTLKYQEDRSGKKTKDCPTQMELREDNKATIYEKNGQKNEMEYYVQLDTEKQLILFPDLKEERANFYYLQEDFIKLEFWGRGVVCEYDRM